MLRVERCPGNGLWGVVTAPRGTQRVSEVLGRTKMRFSFAASTGRDNDGVFGFEFVRVAGGWFMFGQVVNFSVTKKFIIKITSRDLPD